MVENTKLKTLEDMNDIHIRHLSFDAPNIVELEVIVPAEKLSMDDITGVGEKDFLVSKRALQEEAIKWIKAANKITAYTNDTNDTIKAGWAFDDIDDFIKHFFNIIEEDSI